MRSSVKRELGLTSIGLTQNTSQNSYQLHTHLNDTMRLESGTHVFHDVARLTDVEDDMDSLGVKQIVIYIYIDRYIYI